ncbi:hypothetical protein [Nostoc sp. KVJ3]|uniref:hypothetical protein n=1 Tax=Nostoc sp. KVJ3 TaxID=457945 RepID=UPI002236FD4F|nr:hypothetical protein [Nostoc sp. KVJ3]
MVFWLARWQGITDARRDASQNSTLSVVALITPEEKFAVGRKLNDMFVDSFLAIQESDKGHIIISSPEISKTSSPN